MLQSLCKRVVLACCIMTAALLTACASGPQIRADAAHETNFSSYKTFGFVSEPATDKAGYTTLITQHFKYAITKELNALGYQYSEQNPDLLVNFNSNVENRTEVRSSPTATLNYGYYNYRRGIYMGFPIYGNEVDTVHYKVGTVNIDLVDAARKQLIWEGIAEGTLRKKELEQPQQAIENTVSLIFQKFPTQVTTK